MTEAEQLIDNARAAVTRLADEIERGQRPLFVSTAVPDVIWHSLREACEAMLEILRAHRLGNLSDSAAATCLRDEVLPLVTAARFDVQAWAARQV